MHRLIAISIASLIALPAYADTIKERIIGVWLLIEGGEQSPDGKFTPYWDAGQMLFTASGQYSLQLSKDRPKSEGMSDPRFPVGPMLAQFGTYKVDEDAKRLSYHMDYSSTPALNGRDRSQAVQMDGDTFTTISPLLKLPHGDDVHPANHWRRVR